MLTRLPIVPGADEAGVAIDVFNLAQGEWSTSVSAHSIHTSQCATMTQHRDKSAPYTGVQTPGPLQRGSRADMLPAALRARLLHARRCDAAQAHMVPNVR
jgi:hypothetical protein